MANGEWYYVIHQWMQELGLRGTELNLFAILYGYSQQEDGCFYGTRATLAKRCGVSSTRTIDTALESLLNKGLIRKKIVKNGEQTLITYSTRAKSAQGCAKNAQGVLQNLEGGCAEIAHKNNKEENKIEKKLPPTPQAVAEYVRSRGFRDPEGFADMFVEFCTNAGWRFRNGEGEPIANWKNYIVSAWEQNHKNKTYPRTQQYATQQMTDNQFTDFLR